MSTLTIQTETCDRCGPSVKAVIELTLQSGGQLVVCGHHANEICTLLEAKGQLPDARMLDPLTEAIFVANGWS